MRRFLTRTILFILPIILLMLAADFWLTKQFRQFDKGNYAVWNDLIDGRVNADIVIYGSSRADVHFN
ncbi:MAG TPA: hypothetical protein VMR70_00045, partial [Flavisolibacter sp.]|nr:hypothetical protein [Flavisolibacter sp.]